MRAKLVQQPSFRIQGDPSHGVLARDRADTPCIEQHMALTPNRRDIGQSQLFDGLSQDDLKSILSRSSRQEVPRGYFLYHQGEPAKTMFLIEVGRVRLKETTEDGREVLIRLIYPGEVFGAVIADALYRATAQADRPVRAYAWTATAVTELLDRFPPLQKNLFAVTKRLMYLSRDRLRMLATASVERRIDWALAYLAKRAGLSRGDGIVIAEPSVQRDIADLAATTLYTANRVLSAYERRGFLTKQRGRIVLLRPLRKKVPGENRSDLRAISGDAARGGAPGGRCVTRETDSSGRVDRDHRAFHRRKWRLGRDEGR